jgi:D-alanyl-D-alanine carboxypeptidase
VLSVARVALPAGVSGRLRDAPNGNVLHAVAGDTLVYVLAGREHTGDGLTWVRIQPAGTSLTGWFAEILLEYLPQGAPGAAGSPPAATALTPTAAPIACHLAADVPADWLTFPDPETGLGRDFEPADLAEVPLDPANIAFRPVLLRASAHAAMLDLVGAMNAAGLRPWVLSGFRSYSEQALAYEKWQTLYPDRAPDISALPGHSEHQLGLAVDFSTPYMVDVYGDWMHVRFAETPEGQWLKQHAAAYGFTLSYPPNAIERTGFAWEPWHFRYVGLLAPALQAEQVTLTEYVRACGLSNP